MNRNVTVPEGTLTSTASHATWVFCMVWVCPASGFQLSVWTTPGSLPPSAARSGMPGCNLEDSTMTILQGHFAILLVVSAADETSVTSLEVALAPVSETFDLLITVRSIEGAEPGPVEGSGSEAISISIHGADRPGIVHDISGALADAGGNVVDLSTQLVGEPENPVYVMTLRAIVPRGDSDRVAVAVKTTAQSLGVQCTVREDSRTCSEELL